MSNQGFYIPETLNMGGKILSLATPIVMGVINVNENSFYSGSRTLDPDEIVKKCRQMIDEGASIIDLGAMSTKPGSHEIDLELEIKRLEIACSAIRNYFPEVFISIDTYRSAVLEALEPYEINMVNDISGGQYDESIYKWASIHSVPYVLMHMKGTPETMSFETNYTDMIKEMLDYFIAKIDKALHAGVKDLVIDPGFGFAKTIEQNFYLMNHLHVFKILEFPILVGLSRKSFIWKTLGLSPDEALNGTSAIHMQALTHGAKILRVHDVKEAKQVIKLWCKLNNINCV